jgi:hypothetical protein
VDGHFSLYAAVFLTVGLIVWAIADFARDLWRHKPWRKK